jgi:hypothetical protein
MAVVLAAGLLITILCFPDASPCLGVISRCDCGHRVMPGLPEIAWLRVAMVLAKWTEAASAPIVLTDMDLHVLLPPAPRHLCLTETVDLEPMITPSDSFNFTVASLISTTVLIV